MVSVNEQTVLLTVTAAWIPESIAVSISSFQHYIRVAFVQV